MEHSHPHEHHHPHEHSHEHCQAASQQKSGGSILTIRSFSGLSGDMLLCGLSRLSDSMTTNQPTSGKNLS